MIDIAMATPASGQRHNIFISAHAWFFVACRSTCFTKFVISRVVFNVQRLLSSLSVANEPLYKYTTLKH